MQFSDVHGRARALGNTQPAVRARERSKAGPVQTGGAGLAALPDRPGDRECGHWPRHPLHCRAGRSARGSRTQHPPLSLFSLLTSSLPLSSRRPAKKPPRSPTAGQERLPAKAGCSRAGGVQASAGVQRGRFGGPEGCADAGIRRGTPALRPCGSPAPLLGGGDPPV